MSVLLPVACVRTNFDPMDNPPWGCSPVSRNEVLRATATGGLASEHPRTLGGPDWSRQDHIARIAYLVLHGWTTPLDIDVGVPSIGCHIPWPILDGIHRLAAAIVRGDSTIAASVGGDMAYAQELFGVDCGEGIDA